MSVGYSEFSMKAGKTAGDKSMQTAGRKEWNDDDYQAASLARRVVDLEEKLARLRQPVVYHLRNYPETCPECGDRHRLMSNGPAGFVCYACWLLAELERADTRIFELETARPSRQIAGCAYVERL